MKRLTAQSACIAAGARERLGDSAPLDALIQAVGLRPVDGVTRHEIWREIKESLPLVTDLEMQVFWMRFGDAHTSAQVARELDVSEARLGFIELRALEKIRAVMPLGQMRFVGSPTSSGWPVQWVGQTDVPQAGATTARVA
jgi:DNA-directed RNA polymerase specialized sigma24 family protein